ncbi:protein-export chaperone SecB [Sphingomonas sp.]|uniref:protein-export chaperone SecB n=1 Tax=Sphingomonas sp. TaxID=28214 RepID=UPI002EDAB782
MDEPENAAPIGEPLANGADTAPSVGVISQYVKDFSFENPNSPAVYQMQGQPQFDVQFNIGSGEVGQDVYEVVLKIDVRAENEGQVAFVVDLSYAGLFAARNIPAEHLQPFLLGEAPRLLFPFARRVLADAVRDGGFPPLMLEPIDFNGLYYQQLEARAAEGAAGEAGQA